MRHRWIRIEETLMLFLMRASLLVVLGSLVFILATILIKGLPALNLAMLTQIPRGGYYLGKEGGILNAITGSLALAGGATAISFCLALAVAIYLHNFCSSERWASVLRLALDVLWGIPSIVYGAFGFTVMLFIGLRASLLGGIVALVLLELPIMARTMDEVMNLVPSGLKEASHAVGATRLETAFKVVVRQTLPGLITALLLGFGRGIGDAASVLFTAGYTDRLPSSLFRPVASLPLAVFFQLGTPVADVRARAYASALILTGMILVISLLTRYFSRWGMRNVIR
ncbi:MAG: phosphate ABC transporter permease PstA [Anaerolineales bacterium]|nr:phosphate ABC transporter permease PstA [Anaerolineales bacterium]